MFSSGPLPGGFGSLQRACPPGGTPSQLGSLHRARPHREGTHKHLKTSGLEKQSTQLCEVHQWQSEQAAVAARALPDFSAVPNSPVFDRNRKDEGRFGRSKELNHRGCLGADELQGPVQRLTLRGGREHRGTVAAARQFLSKLAFSVPRPEPRLYPAACDRCGVQQAKARTNQPAGLGTGSFAARGAHICVHWQLASLLSSKPRAS